MAELPDADDPALCGLRVVVYPNDHRPAHVHVIGSEGEAAFLLNCPAGPVELRENYRLSRAEIAEIAAALIGEVAKLCEAWERIHGFG